MKHLEAPTVYPGNEYSRRLQNLPRQAHLDPVLPVLTQPRESQLNFPKMRRLSTLPRGTKRLYGICLHLAVGASIWGYNIGILSSVLVHPGWREALDDPTPAQIGLVTGVYYLGTLLSFTLLSHPLADYLGRRRAAVIGTCALCLGATCMAAANGGAAVGIMALGRWVCGVGVGVVSTAVPLYQRCEHGFNAVFLE